VSDTCFYVTTPIYYVNDMPHIGHAYTTVAADVLARYHRLRGEKVFFLTGTDEHGQKIERAAAERGETPIELADRVVRRYTEHLLPKLTITNDDFIRTTEDRHVQVVQKVFERLRETDDIYFGQYEGWYCVSCENFLVQGDLLDGKKCPDCTKPVEWVTEDTYFFRLSKYQDGLLKFYEDHPNFPAPPTRRNEMLNRIREGLRDISVSRTTIEWGVEIPWDTDHKIYVWIDALLNYISAPGFNVDEGQFGSIWPADVHLIGKDIVWFHAVIWPAVLMALGEELPKQVFAHGWWQSDEQKMSKSVGNIVDPVATVDEYGADPFRYFLLREMPFGADGNYSENALIQRTNSELGNDLGNLLHRTLNMIEKYRGGIIPASESKDDDMAETRALIHSLKSDIEEGFVELQFSQMLERIWEVVRAGNRYVEEKKPWKLAKDPDAEAELSTTLYNLAELLRVVSVYIEPFMPTTAASMRKQLGWEPETLSFDAVEWGGLSAGKAVSKGNPLFPRIEKE